VEHIIFLLWFHPNTYKCTCSNNANLV
jgi:hypothetical protein